MGSRAPRSFFWTRRDCGVFEFVDPFGVLESSLELRHVAGGHARQGLVDEREVQVAHEQQGEGISAAARTRNGEQTDAGPCLAKGGSP